MMKTKMVYGYSARCPECGEFLDMGKIRMVAGDVKNVQCQCFSEVEITA